MKHFALAAAAFAVLTAAAHTASAFCGFYVSGSGQKLANDATQVVMMREGTRTSLAMQNDYKGPPEKFAMIIPVPVVLQKDNVKTLPKDVFAKIEELDAPRLVEYWEQDPCSLSGVADAFGAGGLGLSGIGEGGGGRGEGIGLGVKVEAHFDVGEYEIVILSAKDSTGLDTWLKQEKYSIPEGAEPVLRPYVAAGMKFFVAKVDPAKVTFENGHAALSPLRFHYDTDTFTLPVRLGLLNSSGTQDLIVHIIGKGKRYEAANYPNVTIPTNLDVEEATSSQFAAFYAALFDRTAEKNPKAVVTEYSWDAGNCDPCPGPPLDASQVATFGGDIMPTRVASVPGGGSLGGGQWGGFYGGVQGYVLTRLHLRYGKDTLGDDIVFREAPPITGGREGFARFGSDAGAFRQERGSKPAPENNFQARYVIRHAWTGPMLCDHPERGNWGGPPQTDAAVLFQPSSKPRAATKLAFAPRGQLQLASFVSPSQVPELSLLAVVAVPTPAMSAAAPDAGAAAAKAKSSGCLGCAVGGGDPSAPLALGAAGFVLLAWRRRYLRRVRRKTDRNPRP